MFMLSLLVGLGLIPLGYSVVVVRRADQRARLRFEIALEMVQRSRAAQKLNQSPFASVQLDPVGFEAARLDCGGYSPYFMGDISCHYNARSAHLLCAVNPTGPCQGCRSYRPLELDLTTPVAMAQGGRATQSVPRESPYREN
jgi:hypothetical protein